MICKIKSVGTFSLSRLAGIIWEWTSSFRAIIHFSAVELPIAQSSRVCPSSLALARPNSATSLSLQLLNLWGSVCRHLHSLPCYLESIVPLPFIQFPPRVCHACLSSLKYKSLHLFPLWGHSDMFFWTSSYWSKKFTQIRLETTELSCLQRPLCSPFPAPLPLWLWGQLPAQPSNTRIHPGEAQGTSVLLWYFGSLRWEPGSIRPLGPERFLSLGKGISVLWCHLLAVTSRRCLASPWSVTELGPGNHGLQSTFAAFQEVGGKIR